jgi:hypothetical protein
MSEEIVQEQNLEGQPNEGSPEGNETTPFDLSLLNERFKTSYEDESSLKSVFENADKYKDYDAKVSEYESKLTDLNTKLESKTKDFNSMIDQYDGKSVFANESIRKQNEIAKKFPDKDPGVVSSVLNSDLGNMSASELLVMADKLRNPISGVSDTDRLEGILDMLNIESDDLSSLQGKDLYKYKTEVGKAMRELGEIKDFEVPENSGFDIESARRQREEQLVTEKEANKQKWEPITKEISNKFPGIEKVPITDNKGNVIFEYSYLADDNFKASYGDELLNSVLEAGLPATRENLQVAANRVQEDFVFRNFSKIINDVYQQGMTRQKDDSHALVNNDKPTNTMENNNASDKGGGMTLKEWVNRK